MVGTSNAELNGRNHSPNWLILCFVSDHKYLNFPRSENFVTFVCKSVVKIRNIYFFFSTFTSRLNTYEATNKASPFSFTVVFLLHHPTLQSDLKLSA